MVHRVNRQLVIRARNLRAVTRLGPRPAVRIANPANRPIPAPTIRVPTILSHLNRIACPVHRAAIPHRAIRTPVIPNQAIPSRANRTQVIQNRYRVHRLARVDRRPIQVIPRQATRAVRAQVIAIRAAVIQAIAIPKAPIANPKAIPKANHIQAADRSVLAPRNLRAIARVNRKANPNQRAALIANRIRVAIPTAQADQVTPAAVRRVRANQVAQVLLKAPPKAIANRPAKANRRAKAKIQVAIDHRIALAIIQAIATQQVIIHQAVHPTAHRIVIPKAIQIHSHQILTHLTVVAQAPLIRSHQANHRQEVPAAVATARGSGHAVGSCLIRIAKAQNLPRAPAATTAQ